MDYARKPVCMTKSRQSNAQRSFPQVIYKNKTWAMQRKTVHVTESQRPKAQKVNEEMRVKSLVNECQRENAKNVMKRYYHIRRTIIPSAHVLQTNMFHVY